MLFSTSCDFPSITTQAFSAILAASETSASWCSKVLLTNNIHRITEGNFILHLLPVSLWFTITCRSIKPKYEVQISRTEGGIVYIMDMSHMRKNVIGALLGNGFRDGYDGWLQAWTDNSYYLHQIQQSTREYGSRYFIQRRSAKCLKTFAHHTTCSW